MYPVTKWIRAGRIGKNNVIVDGLKKELPEAKLVKVNIDGRFGHDYVSLYINFMDEKYYPNGRFHYMIY